MNPWIVIPVVVALALVWLALVAWATYRAADRPVTVTCPETHAPVKVRRDPLQAVKSLFSRKSQRVVACDRWPERADCDRACERDLRA